MKKIEAFFTAMAIILLYYPMKPLIVLLGTIAEGGLGNWDHFKNLCKSNWVRYGTGKEYWLLVKDKWDGADE